MNINENIAGQIEYNMALQNSQDNFPIPTKMNIVRFVQDVCRKHGCNGVGDDLELSEEIILEEYYQFFSKFTR